MVWSNIFIITFVTWLGSAVNWNYIPPRGLPIWGYFGPTHVHRTPPQNEAIPMDQMVDLTNAIGVAILQPEYKGCGRLVMYSELHELPYDKNRDHSHSRSNFAFSPYGMASVLVVLYEGACGESARQIQATFGFPADKDVIRVGFRDIHRHLRSYFSHEGFLSGITLNKDTSSLNPEYKIILKYYGYDVELPTDDDKKQHDESPSTTPVSAATTESNVLSSKPSITNQPTPEPSSTEQTNLKTTPDLNETKESGSTEVTPSGTVTDDLNVMSEVSTTSYAESTQNIESETESTTTQPEEDKNESTTMSTTIKNEMQPHDEKEVLPDNKDEVLQSTNPFVATTEMNLDKASEESETVANEPTTSIGETLDNGMLIPQSLFTEGTTVQQVTELSDSVNDVTVHEKIQTTTYETEKSEVTPETSERSTEPDSVAPEMVSGTTVTDPNNWTESSSVATTQRMEDVTQEEKVTLQNDEQKTQATTIKETTPLFPAVTTEATGVLGTVTVPNQTGETPVEHVTEAESESESESPSTYVTIAGTTEIPETPPATTTEIVVTTSQPETTIIPEISTITTDETTTSDDTQATEVNAIESTTRRRKRELLLKYSGNSIRVSSKMPLTESRMESIRGYLNTFNSSRASRMKRTVIDYLKSPMRPDISLQLQNGMYDTFVSRNANMYRNLPSQLFLVDGVFDTPVPMMTYTNIFPFGYIPQLHSKAMEFPLDDVRYKLLILLPLERRGLKQLLHDLESCSLREIINSLRPTTVKATIPTFMVEGFVILTSTLQRLGVWDVFDPRRSNLSRMSSDPELYVRNVEQSVTVVIRNYVEILDIQTRTMAARHLIFDFDVTHPFLYFVLDTATNVALMAGQMLDPLNSRIY
ncbi:hypothetical protein RUM44_004155 [Polyplax serrata]|uniref:Serpin domain-containing protein n=1 Tax=Polyplax serrata TaxID=468196 RepID=A0ABR1B207_POLSC